MSDANRIDELLRLAYRDVRILEPTDEQIHAALARRATERNRTQRVRRILAVAAATLTLGAGTALAVPQTRDAIFDTYSTFKEFLTGGPPPGPPVPTGEQPGKLNWFAGSDRATGSIIAQNGAVRLIAFRDPKTGVACLGYGRAAEECRLDQDWIDQLVKSPIRLSGTIPQPDAAGRIPLIGLTADHITTLQIRYADGTIETATGIQHGFVVFADPKRDPTTLSAQDRSGSVVATVDITDQQWEFPGVTLPGG